VPHRNWERSENAAQESETEQPVTVTHLPCAAARAWRRVVCRGLDTDVQVRRQLNWLSANSSEAKDGRHVARTSSVSVNAIVIRLQFRSSRLQFHFNSSQSSLLHDFPSDLQLRSLKVAPLHLGRCTWSQNDAYIEHQGTTRGLRLRKTTTRLIPRKSRAKGKAARRTRLIDQDCGAPVLSASTARQSYHAK
jgi:hypothetical protein